MPLEHFEKRTQKTVSSEHSRRSDLHGSNAGLVRDRFNRAWRGLGLWTNKRSAFSRRARVADPHRNAVLDCGLNRLRVQNLRAEVRKLRGLAVRQSFYCLRIGNDTWIGSQDAGHVGPNLNLCHA